MIFCVGVVSDYGVRGALQRGIVGSMCVGVIALEVEDGISNRFAKGCIYRA